MRLIAFMILASLCITAAPASVTDCDIALKSAGYPIDGVSGSGYNDPNLRVDCSACTAAQATAALALAQTASTWNNVQPNLPAFKVAVMADTTIPAASLVELMKFTGTLNDLVNTPTALKQAWSAIVSIDAANSGPLSQSCTDGTPVVTKIQNYAIANNMPLQ